MMRRASAPHTLKKTGMPSRPTSTRRVLDKISSRDESSRSRTRAMVCAGVMVARVEEADASVAVVAGSYKDTRGAAQGDYVDVRFLDVCLKPGARWQVDTDPAHTVFAYVYDGDCFLLDGKTPLLARHDIAFKCDCIHRELLIVSGFLDSVASRLYCQ